MNRNGVKCAETMVFTKAEVAKEWFCFSFFYTLYLCTLKVNRKSY